MVIMTGTDILNTLRTLKEEREQILGGGRKVYGLILTHTPWRATASQEHCSYRGKEVPVVSDHRVFLYGRSLRNRLDCILQEIWCQCDEIRGWCTSFYTVLNIAAPLIVAWEKVQREHFFSCIQHFSQPLNTSSGESFGGAYCGHQK